MRNLITANNENCVGCNRCAKVCPVEMACIMRRDENGNTIVDIDHSKCISCGACIEACNHNAREYDDDTEQFIGDLQRGVKISLIVAPALRANFDEPGRLLAWLRRLGADKIYDVSLGADICTWAHIRYIQKNRSKGIITQPCPAIVNYCLMYRNELLKYLSPVHSPMLCTAVYMKQYEDINTPIAAISPCIAKTHEFDATDLVKYNVTFKKLFEYVERNNIVLPSETSDFDHYPSGPGSLYSMPGGLKENVEFFLGKALRIDKSEGQAVVYEALDEFARQPLSNLPDIFDVLNCAEGCNAGTGCVHNRNIFEINTDMETARQAASKNRANTYFEKLYQDYDKMFRLDHFIRRYKATPVHMPMISDSDIEKAYKLLGKENPSERNFDCGACGCHTCAEMARKVALKVNIPENCIQKNREDIKRFVRVSRDIESIKDSSDVIAANISKVNTTITEFNSMAKKIDNIAMQISIIAINASIEAARAGEFGRAFSVIASEIQTLARTSKETVSGSGEITSAANSSMKEVNQMMSHVVSAANTAHDAIQKINQN